MHGTKRAPIPWGKLRMEANFAALVYRYQPTEANARILKNARNALAHAFADSGK